MYGPNELILYRFSSFHSPSILGLFKTNQEVQNKCSFLTVFPISNHNNLITQTISHICWIVSKKKKNTVNTNVIRRRTREEGQWLQDLIQMRHNSVDFKTHWNTSLSTAMISNTYVLVAPYHLLFNLITELPSLPLLQDKLLRYRKHSALRSRPPRQICMFIMPLLIMLCWGCGIMRGGGNECEVRGGGTRCWWKVGMTIGGWCRFWVVWVMIGWCGDRLKRWWDMWW